MTPKEEAQEIQKYLEITCSNNPEEIQERIADLAVYMARSGEMLAQAKREVAKARINELVKKVIEPLTDGVPMSATTQKELINLISIEEQFLVDWLERINRSCTHQIDALRSLLSYEKENLRLSRTGY